MQFEEVFRLPAGVRTEDSMACREGFLCIVGRSVRWYSPCGRSVHKEFNCESTPIQSIFCSFPLAGPLFHNSVVVLLPLNKVRIFALSGRYDVHLGSAVSRIFASSIGLLLEREVDPELLQVSEDLPSVFAITHPIMRVGKLHFSTTMGIHSVFEGGNDESQNNKLIGIYKILSVNGAFVCTIDTQMQHVGIFRIQPLHQMENEHVGEDTVFSSGFLEKSTEVPGESNEGSHVNEAWSYGLEVRGHAISGPSRSSADLKRNTVSPGHDYENPFLIGHGGIEGAQLRYARGALRRQKRVSRENAAISGLSSVSDSRTKSPMGRANAEVDSFYNALLGIDRTWSLQQNPSTTAAWLRQPSGEFNVAQSMQSPEPGGADHLAFNATTMTPSSAHSRDHTLEHSGISSGDRSHLSSGFHRIGSHLSPEETFTLAQICTVPLRANDIVHREVDKATNKISVSGHCDTFFDICTLDKCAENNDTLPVDAPLVSVSLVASPYGSEIFVDILYKTGGSFKRYVLPCPQLPVRDLPEGA